MSIQVEAPTLATRSRAIKKGCSAVSGDGPRRRSPEAFFGNDMPDIITCSVEISYRTTYFIPLIVIAHQSKSINHDLKSTILDPPFSADQ